jgi:excisionase family DNA binding protein
MSKKTAVLAGSARDPTAHYVECIWAGRLGREPLLKTNDFDPLAYIESAFLDTRTVDDDAPSRLADEMAVTIPTIKDYLQNAQLPNGEIPPVDLDEYEDRPKRSRFRKTVMSAPRPRRAKQEPVHASIDPALQSVWEHLPKNIEFLCRFYDDSVTANYYRGEFTETRQDLIRRLLDPEITLEETSRLLGVCPATVRRYTNRGWLDHHRTKGGQRRFRLSDVVRFVGEHGRFPEA